MPMIGSMKDRPSEIQDENWNALTSVYKSPDDIDVYPAGLSETPLQGFLLCSHQLFQFTIPLIKNSLD
jgi:hypothetical protein